MSTQLFLTSTADNSKRWGSGTDNPPLVGGSSGWNSAYLDTARGAGIVADNVTCVTGPTTGLEIDYNTGIRFHWLSPPLAEDITISGSITFNIWAYESVMAANATIGAVVDRIRGSDGSVVSTVVTSIFGSELGTASAAKNWSATPTSTNFLKGDRIRVRLYADDYTGGTMDVGIVTANWAAASSGAQGDSYITFTENFAFITTNPGTEQVVDWTGAGVSFSDVAANHKRATCFFWGGGTVTSVEAYLERTANPTDNVVLAIQADSSGNPDGTDIVSASIAGSTLSTTPGSWKSFDIADTALSPGKYWIVLTRSGSQDLTNYYIVHLGTTWDISWYDSYSSGWTITRSQSLAYKLHGGQGGTQLFLTNTAAEVDPNGASYDAKEAWTSRGGGVQTSVTNTAAGWLTPLLCTTSAGNNYVEWFTKGLAAFTLTGVCLIHARAQESAAATNAAIRVQLAVCASDGSTPVVWAESSSPNQLSTIEAVVNEFYLSGDDVSVTDGQRIRIRIYLDDYEWNPMNTGRTGTLYYAGAAGATGDTYVIFPQALTEAASGTNLVIQNAAHSHSAGNVALTQVHSLAVQAAAHGHTAANVALTQLHVLVIQNASHGHTAANVVLVPVITLAIANAAHAHSAGSLALTQVHQLAVQGATHSHSAANVALTQVHVLTIQAASHTHSAANVVLEAAGILVIQNASHSHTAANVALTQVHQLTVASASHGHTAANVVLSTETYLAIANGAHAHTAGGVTLTQVHQLAVQAGTHGHSAANVGLTQVHYILPANASHAHTVQQLVLAQLHQLAIGDAYHADSAANVQLSVQYTLAIQGATHAHIGQNAPLEDAYQVKNVVATPINANRIDITWDDVAALAGHSYGFDIERNGSVIVTYYGTTSYSDTTVEPETQYAYRVRAVETIS